MYELVAGSPLRLLTMVDTLLAVCLIDEYGDVLASPFKAETIEETISYYLELHK